MRIGKIEKAILEYLSIWRSVDPQWTWNTGQGLSELADKENIEEFESGNLVPVWMLRRDLPFSKPALSRALKTLDNKGFITRCGGDLSCIDKTVSFYTKYVRLNVNFAKLPK